MKKSPWHLPRWILVGSVVLAAGIWVVLSQGSDELPPTPLSDEARLKQVIAESNLVGPRIPAHAVERDIAPPAEPLRPVPNLFDVHNPPTFSEVRFLPVGDPTVLPAKSAPAIRSEMQQRVLEAARALNAAKK